MKTTPTIGDTVIYEIDSNQVIAEVIEVYENGDIRTDQDGVRTKNEYKQLKKLITMKTIELKEKDTDRMKSLNAKNNYGLNYDQFSELVEEHRQARKANNEYKMALIEYRLTDINFHSQCAMLEKGKYDQLLADKW